MELKRALACVQLLTIDFSLGFFYDTFYFDLRVGFQTFDFGRDHADFYLLTIRPHYLMLLFDRIKRKPLLSLFSCLEVSHLVHIVKLFGARLSHFFIVIYIISLFSEQTLLTL